MAGEVDADTVTLHGIHRFPNGVREIDGHLRWDIAALYDEVLVGLAGLVSRFPQVESIGIDTWGVDYGLLDDRGTLLAPPVAYRDVRTNAVVDDVHAVVSREELFRINGLQFLPFNTLYQLVAEQQSAQWPRVARIALLPDLIAYWLTGELGTEATNASTTGLVDVQTGEWSSEVLDRLDIPADLLPPIERPGTVRGRLLPEVCARLGAGSEVVVTTVGSHDTASAVVAVPALNSKSAYVSSGTWSLVGVELAEPVVTEAARETGFTNERGVDDRIRFLRNLGGLWLLQESLRTWDVGDASALLGEVAALPDGGPVVDVDDPVFIAPGAMPERIAAAASARGQQRPQTPAEIVRCILDSLAAAYCTTVRSAAALTSTDIEVVHIVGGGAQNELLCRLTARATELPVTAGPTEATALGNVLVQARAHGAAPTSLEDLRAVVVRSVKIQRYEPHQNTLTA
jgi:rhamnulokinase